MTRVYRDDTLARDMWRKRSSPRDSTPGPGQPAADAAPAARRGRARRAVGYFRRRPRAAGLLFVAVLFLALNALAFLHAYSMTHFVSGGSRMPRPDQMGRTARVVAILTGVRIARPLNTLTPSSFDLAYTTHRYRGADGTNYEAWHIPAGGPPWRRLPWLQPRGTVLLFHGYAGCKAGVLREAEIVRRAGYDAFLVDFRGSGGSSGSSTTIGYREADDVAEAVRYVQKTFSPKRTVIYGRSMGAAAALRAVSARNVRPDALVVESPFDRMLTTVDHRFSLVGVPAFPLSRMLVFWGGVQHGYWAFGHNPVEYARAVSCPTLLIRAGRDPFVRQNEAESVFRNFAGVKRMLVFEGAGHQACVDVDRRKWDGTVTDFLLSAPRGAGR